MQPFSVGLAIVLLDDQVGVIPWKRILEALKPVSTACLKLWRYMPPLAQASHVEDLSRKDKSRL